MDPSGGGIGKAAGELLEEMQKAQRDLQQDPSKMGGAGEPNVNFSKVMEAQQAQGPQGAHAVDKPGHVGEVAKASNILQQAKINANMASTRVGSAAKTESSKLAKMLTGLIRGQDKMSNIMNMALSGRQFSPPELIFMQAGVYRFSQELELTGKVVEKATSGIKQTMNTQV